MIMQIQFYADVPTEKNKMFSYELKKVSNLDKALRYFVNRYSPRALFVVIRDGGKPILNTRIFPSSIFLMPNSN
jgi:hypothetical protein